MSTFGSPISAIGSAAVLAGAALLLVRRRLLRTYAVNLPDVRAELTAVHTRYEAALAENDVAALDELFFDHEQLLSSTSTRCSTTPRAARMCTMSVMPIVVCTLFVYAI